MTSPASPPNDSRSAKDARLRRFIDEYSVDHNGVRAYFVAFGRTTQQGRERSRNAAAVEASKLLKKPAVRDEIRAVQKHQRQRTLVTADRVIREIAAIAFSDMGDFIDFSVEGLPRPKSAGDVPFLAKPALKTFKLRTRRVRSRDGGSETIEEVESFEIAMHDKLGALDKLAKHLGLYSKTSVLEAILDSLPEPLRDQVISALIDAR